MLIHHRSIFIEVLRINDTFSPCHTTLWVCKNNSTHGETMRYVKCFANIIHMPGKTSIGRIFLSYNTFRFKNHSVQFGNSYHPSKFAIRISCQSSGICMSPAWTVSQLFKPRISAAPSISANNSLHLPSWYSNPPLISPAWLSSHRETLLHVIRSARGQCWCASLIVIHGLTFNMTAQWSHRSITLIFSFLSSQSAIQFRATSHQRTRTRRAFIIPQR